MLLIPLIAVLLIVTGAVLLKRGRWPRRSGVTPHCPKCDYILSGDQSRCPECGGVVRPETVVLGERHQRASMARAGVALTCLGFAALALALTIVFNAMDWNQHKPLGWLLRSIDEGSSPSWREIQRRIDLRMLSDAEEDAVVEKGLQVQHAHPTYGAGPNVLDYIANRYAQKRLTSAQTDRFLAGVLKADLAVRPVVGTDSRIPCSLLVGGSAPSVWSREMTPLEYQIDDGPVQKMNGPGGIRAFAGSSLTFHLTPVPPPGQHHLRFKVQMSITMMTAASSAGGAPARSVDHDLSTNFTVVPGQSPVDTIAFPNASVLRSLLTARAKLQSLSGQPLAIYLGAEQLPIDAAFEVFARMNGKEYPAGTVSYTKGDNVGSMVQSAYPENGAATVDVIFRTSEATVRDTVNMMQIWKGEIVILNVPIDRSAATSTTSRP